MALTDSLISYWPLNESSGNAIDAHGSNDLTETGGTIDAASGVITGARDFEAGDTEYFEIANNTDLTTGDIDFTFSVWVNLETAASTQQFIAGKLTDGGVGDWQLNANGSNIGFDIWNAGLKGRIFQAAPSTGVWAFIVAWHDSVANTVNTQINNGSVASSATSGAPGTSTIQFRLGAYANNTRYFDGLMCEAGFWKRVLSSDERAELYNSGAGLAYPFTGGVVPPRNFGRAFNRAFSRGVL